MTKTENNWFKLFALMAVAGVAKALFGPPPAPRITYNQAADLVEKVVDKKDDDETGV